MILSHLPALQVVVPLVSAPTCVVLRHRDLAWGFTLAVSWATFGIAILLLTQVLAHGPLSYALGGWAAPWGIEYRIDLLNAFLLLIVAGIGAIVLPFARTSVLHEIRGDRVALFYAAYLLCLTGLLGIAITGDAFNLFVFLEISSLSSYALISLGQDRRALTASFQYLIMGTIGATFFLIGVGLLYMMTGTLNMADLASRLPDLTHTRTVLAAFAFITVGVSLKLALFPLHLWLPNAYAYAPSVATAFLAATATKVAVYVLIRFFFTVFGGSPALEKLPIMEILMVLASAGILVTSAVAIVQENVKRLLAYSSVAQIGYMVLGISFASVSGLTAGIIHLFNHALMKGGLFLALGCVALRAGSVRLEHLQGIGSQMPWTMASFVIGGLSLIGLPLTVGFISKWYLVLAALEQGWWMLAFLVLISSLLAVGYIWRVVETAYFKSWPAGKPPLREAPLIMLVPTWTLMVLAIYFGIETSLPVGLAHNAAEMLVGGAR